MDMRDFQNHFFYALYMIFCFFSNWEEKLLNDCAPFLPMQASYCHVLCSLLYIRIKMFICRCVLYTSKSDLLFCVLTSSGAFIREALFYEGKTFAFYHGMYGSSLNSMLAGVCMNCRCSWLCIHAWVLVCCVCACSYGTLCIIVCSDRESCEKL